MPSPAVDRSELKGLSGRRSLGMTVSIIIPTFNRSSLLVNAIESVVRQTYANHEIIVVDDGSTDDTSERLAPYRDRIRYVYQSNKGIAAALNKGIEVAKGQWISILADDDLWLPTKLESQVRAMDQLGEEFGACFTNCSYVGDPARTVSAFEEAKLAGQFDFWPLEDPHKYVLAKYPALFAQSMLVLRSLLQKVEGFDERLVVGEDTDLLFRLAFHTRFCVVAKPLVEIDRSPLLPRLTDLYKSKNESVFACIGYRYRKWLALQELTDSTIRQTIQESMERLYYARIVENLYRSDLTGAFEKVRELKEIGPSYSRIGASLLSRASRKLFSTLAGKPRKEGVLDANGSSSGKILKSTAIIGGSNGFVALTRIGQLKALAVLLGPAGMGLMGLYSSVVSTVATIGGFGVASSGVREIGEASGSSDSRAVATALAALRRLTLILAAIASFGIFLFRRMASSWVLGSPRYAGAVGVLSLGVLCTIISSSQLAALNGLRRLKDIARVNVVGSAIGTTLTVLLVLLWREPALVYTLTSSAAIMLICSWWYVRRIPRATLLPGDAEVKAVCFSLLRLGAAFLVAGLTATIVLLVTKVIIVNRLGMASAGYFQAAWGMVVFYIDFILNAMGVDFYPHLASRAADQDAANQLVNEQTDVALLLGGPMIMGMMLFAPVLIVLFYSEKFAAVTELVRWLLLGNILKIISWPMGFLVMAHARSKTFVFVELVWASAYLGSLYYGIRYAGIYAAGYAFVVSYLVYTAVLYYLVKRFSGFVWTSKNLISATAVSLSAVLILSLVQHAGITGYLIAGLTALAFGIFSLRRLYGMVEDHTRFRMIPPAIKSFWPLNRTLR